MDQYYKQMQYIQAADAWRSSGMIGGQQTLQGLQDAFSGQKTPAALQAMNMVGTKVTADQVDKWNTRLEKISALAKTKGADPNEIQTMIDGMNIQAGFLNQQGIPTKLVKFAPQTSFQGGVGGYVASHMPDALKTKTIQSVDGSELTPIITGDELTAKQLIDKINAGQADLNTTLNDPRMSPTIRMYLLQKLQTGKKPGK